MIEIKKIPVKAIEAAVDALKKQGSKPVSVQVVNRFLAEVKAKKRTD